MAVPGECNDNFNGKIAGEEKYANAGQMQKGSFLIRPFSIIIAVLAVSVFVASIFIINFKNKSEVEVPARTLYIKDKELFFSDLSDRKPIQLSSGLLESDNKETILHQSNYGIDDKIHFSEDGKVIFFSDNLNDNSYTLYYRDIRRRFKVL